MPAEKSATPAPAAAPKSGSKLPWILVAVLLVGLAGGGGWWWMSQSKASEAAEGEEAAVEVRPQARYFALEPAFVVNLADAGAVRYLQADVQILTRDAATAAALELHAPAIRNRLLLLFGQQSADQLAQRSAKERLQEKALAEVRAALEKESAPAKVEAVLFTSLVTQ